MGRSRAADMVRAKGASGPPGAAPRSQPSSVSARPGQSGGRTVGVTQSEPRCEAGIFPLRIPLTSVTVSRPPAAPGPFLVSPCGLSGARAGARHAGMRHTGSGEEAKVIRLGTPRAVGLSTPQLVPEARPEGAIEPLPVPGTLALSGQPSAGPVDRRQRA